MLTEGPLPDSPVKWRAFAGVLANKLRQHNMKMCAVTAAVTASYGSACIQCPWQAQYDRMAGQGHGIVL